MKVTGKKNTERIVTLMGVFQCMALILPLGFYKIEPPSSHVGTLWGFLKAPTYLTFIAGIYRRKYLPMLILPKNYPSQQSTLHSWHNQLERLLRKI